MKKQMQKIDLNNDSKQCFYFETTNGVKLFLPLYYGIHVDLDNLTYSFEDCNAPTINDLVKENKLQYKELFNSCSITFDEFTNSASICNKALEYFKQNGYKVTKKAIMHNINAWLYDMKSGYRDDKNNYFLFTPCGCNKLSFRLSTLHKYADWQITYTC